MMKTTAFLAAIVAATTATAATAQTFTFQSMANSPAMAMSNKAPDGRTYGAAAFSGSGETSWADGKKSKYTFKCITMSQPPHDSIFMSHMMCDVAASDGNFFVTFGCNNMSADEQGCVGGLAGTSGVYAGKSGGLTSHGKGAASNGTGQWND
ncbi:MAG: hypothetical protein IPK89_03010 [Sphingomonadales bacterium]|jgi:hypothetical protein|nr:hypothetical protein [Sphingomonadales bacterium]MBP7135547.1 hypothetical protein [Sphingomonadaceae bacterium]MBK6718804.1 hypothetical protein [Sphingomonadales bacterium]MBK7283712.1 hypothetical protein [Sphingomonadales bacterium]MBK8271982.1 hypothetical protein [Sphingomonadales bacterium]